MSTENTPEDAPETGDEFVPELPVAPRRVAGDDEPMIFHAEGWCDGPHCPDPHHAWVRRNNARALGED